MEVKAILLKPYTEEDRLRFIIEQNHVNGYQIEEEERQLVALGLTEEEIKAIEKEHINQLKMTALDFITFLRGCGVSLESIKKYLDENIELDTQLKYCQNVYCGVVKSILPIKIDDITITEEIVEEAFKIKNGEV